MVKIQIFHKSVKGASHIASSKPCQDYSLSYNEDGLQIVVVCDGHGGNTYFRSDVGSKLAAEVTVELLKNFAKCVDASDFKNSEFSITAKPKHNPFIDSDGKRLLYEDLNDEQKQYAIQAQAYIETEGKYPELRALVSELIEKIYEEWINQINSDESMNHFNKKDKAILNRRGLEKAYGCTLLAFMRTKEFWLSFQIGDGTIYCCDKTLKWSNPVPKDCTCFLNYTTSLCDSNPVDEFRYAFNGKGDFPIAVMLCSDGLDGSLRTSANLQDFYEQIINLCIEGDDVVSELETFFPSLSENGNRDDISLSGIVDLSKIDLSSLSRFMELKKHTRGIQNDNRSRKNDIDSIASRVDTLKIKLDRMKENRFSKQIELDEMRKEIKDKESEIANLDKNVKDLMSKFDTLRSELKKKKSEFENWKFTLKNEMAELESENSNSDDSSDIASASDYTTW
jgi:serine/threonine protein phosphatase PrpC/archaellum component FlaC